MTLRLVEPGNVVPLPGSAMSDMESAAQGFANAIAEGTIDPRLALVVTVDREGLVNFLCLGDQVTTSEGIGLLELAKGKIIAGAFR